MLKKLFTLSDNVATKVSEEPNASAFVDAILANHYGIPLVIDGPHMRAREEALDSLSTLTGNTPEPTPEESVLSDMVYIRDEELVDIEGDIEFVVEPEQAPETPQDVVIEEPEQGEVFDPEPDTTEGGQVPDAEIPINVNGVPVVQTSDGALLPKCPTCAKPMTTSFCLNCL